MDYDEINDDGDDVDVIYDEIINDVMMWPITLSTRMHLIDVDVFNDEIKNNDGVNNKINYDIDDEDVMFGEIINDDVYVDEINAYADVNNLDVIMIKSLLMTWLMTM